MEIEFFLIVPQVSEALFIFFSQFFLLLFIWVNSVDLSSDHRFHPLSSLLLSPTSKFLISVIIFFNSIFFLLFFFITSIYFLVFSIFSCIINFYDGSLKVLAKIYQHLIYLSFGVVGLSFVIQVVIILVLGMMDLFYFLISWTFCLLY